MLHKVKTLAPTGHTPVESDKKMLYCDIIAELKQMDAQTLHKIQTLAPTGYTPVESDVKMMHSYIVAELSWKRNNSVTVSEAEATQD